MINPQTHIFAVVVAFSWIVIADLDFVRVLIEVVKDPGGTGFNAGLPLLAWVQARELSDIAGALREQTLSIEIISRVRIFHADFLSELSWCVPHSFLGMAPLDTPSRMLII